MLGGSTIGAAGALQNINSSSASYSNERTPAAGLDVEFASDAASGGFFHADYKKYARTGIEPGKSIQLFSSLTRSPFRFQARWPQANAGQ